MFVIKIMLLGYTQKFLNAQKTCEELKHVCL